ncbi:MAG: asparagine synthase (glutamine-hydrolyzing) [Gammaproteobacteria bacterium]|nr:asparagine synthase (glutamine-hydrolyzing) [Gammaproteobacteria bacterium]
MCGFTGFLDRRGRYGASEAAALATAMAESIRARGPDDGGVWVDPLAGYAVGFRRLSIIDLTESGHQPMVSSNGRYVIAFNGEVYNAEAIRPKLEALGASFRGHSDTEVLLEAFAVWGVERTLAQTTGMFGIALWDRAERRLTLARDRLGKKPVYWGWNSGVLFFGSQPKSFTRHPRWRGELDRDSMAAYVRFGYVPAPRSIYRGIRKLEPGHFVTIEGDDTVDDTCYWDARAMAVSGLRQPLRAGDREAVEGLEAVISEAVRARLVSDVPLGGFLSGGIDSSTVVALMQEYSSEAVKTFSIGFAESGYDEAPHAKAVAAYLGTEHHELYVEPRHALALIPEIPDWYDEPFADSSQLPTYLVSEMTRRHVTVALSGDGGDELFAGYTRYGYLRDLCAQVGRVPTALRGTVTAFLDRVPGGWWDRAARLLPGPIRPSHAGYKAKRLAGLLRPAGRDRLYRDLVSHWHDPEALVLGSREEVAGFWDGAWAMEVPDDTDRMQLIDTVTYLPDDILTKVDRASMAVSLEARVPLLDHRVVEYAWRLPRHLKERGGVTKWALRQVLYRHVPRELIERPKMGFGVPIDAWLRGPLRDWAESLISESRLREEGVFDPAPIRERWSQHLAGTTNWQYPIWVILMFQAWQERWLSG